MVATGKTADEVWKALGTISDPEVPVLSVVDLHIIRSVEINGAEVVVEITPTFVGCPALETIVESIHGTLRTMGFQSIRINRNFVAQWSTDSIGEEARTRLQHFGIAPPANRGELDEAVPPSCPYCGSNDTRVENPFGATLCKKLCYCNSCKQSFEQFRTI